MDLLEEAHRDCVQKLRSRRRCIVLCDQNRYAKQQEHNLPKGSSLVIFEPQGFVRLSIPRDAKVDSFEMFRDATSIRRATSNQGTGGIRLLVKSRTNTRITLELLRALTFQLPPGGGAVCPRPRDSFCSVTVPPPTHHAAPSRLISLSEEGDVVRDYVLMIMLSMTLPRSLAAFLA